MSVFAKWIIDIAVKSERQIIMLHEAKFEVSQGHREGASFRTVS
jgi:hypothetical protein